MVATPGTLWGPLISFRSRPKKKGRSRRTISGEGMSRRTCIQGIPRQVSKVHVVLIQNFVSTNKLFPGKFWYFYFLNKLCWQRESVSGNQSWANDSLFLFEARVLLVLTNRVREQVIQKQVIQGNQTTSHLMAPSRKSFVDQQENMS